MKAIVFCENRAQWPIESQEEEKENGGKKSTMSFTIRYTKNKLNKHWKTSSFLTLLRI